MALKGALNFMKEKIKKKEEDIFWKERMKEFHCKNVMFFFLGGFYGKPNSGRERDTERNVNEEGRKEKERKKISETFT